MTYTNMHNIKDFDLTTSALELKYEKKDSHPDYTRAAYNVSGYGDLTYWGWVRAQLILEQDQLDRDSPYYTGEPYA